MNGIRPENIPILIARDVLNVKKYAAIVLEIEEGVMRFSRNENPRLNVIAVVGPGKFLDKEYKEAVLLEIGIGKSRPYHIPAFKKEKGPWISKRKKWFSLTEHQYRVIAPKIFSILGLLTNERVGNWKCGPNNPFCVPAHRFYWSRKHKTLFNRLSKKPIAKGI